MIETIPLSRLRLSELNVRQHPEEPGTADLEASIAAHGLLTPLTVRPLPRKYYGVLAGGRRLLALTRMAERGEVPEALGVECIVRDVSDGVSTELSMAENLARVALPPVLEYEAFARLIDGGASEAEVAKRFATTELHVKQRCRLGKLHPEIRAALAAGAITLDAAQAYAATADVDLQRRAFDQCGRYGHYAPQIRNAYREMGSADNMAAMIRLVGLDAYTAAGGRAEHDLFSPGHVTRLLDIKLLRELYDAKLAEEHARIAPTLPKSARIQFGYEGLGTPVHAASALTDAQQHRRAEIDTRADEISARLEDIAEIDDDGPATRLVALAGEDQDEVRRLDAELRALEAESEAIHAAGGLPDDQPVVAVARIEDGRLSIAGVYRPAGAPSPIAAPGGAEGLLPASQRAPGAPAPQAALKDAHGLSADAVEVMRSHRRQALQAALMATDKGRLLAADFVTFSTLRSMLSGTHSTAIGAHRPAAREYDPPIGGDDRAGQAGGKTIERIEKRLRGADWMTEKDVAAAFRAFCRLDSREIEEAAGFAGVLMLSRSLNAEGYRVGTHDMLAHMAGITDEIVRRFWSPDEAFFNRMPKARRLDILRGIHPQFAKDAGGYPAGEVSARAARLFRANAEDQRALGISPETLDRVRSWVPDFLRFPGVPEVEEALEPTPIEAFAAGRGGGREAA